jgi:hypothetical protein
MGELLLIELVICAAVIVVAVAVLVLPRLRGSDQSRMPVEGRRGTVAELFDERTPGREVADLPGLSHDAMERDPGASAPAGPEQAAETPAGGVADADLGSPGPDAEPQEPPPAAGAVTFSEQIGSYYEEAERSVADYLAAHGWTEEQGKPVRGADAEPAPASAEAAAEPTARRRLAA